MLNERHRAGRSRTRRSSRNAIREELNTRELLVREAKKKNLHNNADVKQQMDLAARPSSCAPT